MNKLTAIDIIDMLHGCDDKVILDGLIKTNTIINDPKYTNIMCSVSGGSDSDIVIDICTKLDVNKKIHYVWFDTGIEYQATKEHIDYLERRYGIQIIREKAIKTVPYSAKHIGQPFVSKWVSECIQRLQKHGFQWEDEDYETLVKRYCKKAEGETKEKLDKQWQNGKKPYHWTLIDDEWYSGCVGELRWWCNTKQEKNGKPSRFCISQNSYLKEFMISNPPTFNISAECCKYAKKSVSKYYIKQNKIDLVIMGIRKAEGGVRGTAYKTCYSVNDSGADYHRPIFFYSNQTKITYENLFNIKHSRCYSEYGMVRTGCAGCPFNMHILNELHIIQEHEPHLYTAVTNIFSDSYAYTEQYRQFQKIMKKNAKRR